MKTIILFIFISFNCQAQSLYNPRANDKVSYVNSEAFSISFTKSLYGLTFEQNDRKLNPSLKKKIERYMKNTNRPKFKGQGKFTLDIVKRNNQYFVVESRKPERLLEL
ncbi:hypothetical protein [Empedobacter brevis]|uniref:hypothetical protein n=1 Tax=Empedobacter brevis TaxID=247 RepID=UPI0028A0703F|nr:hypothetical protein [Empedobacter brevis]